MVWSESYSGISVGAFCILDDGETDSLQFVTGVESH